MSSSQSHCGALVGLVELSGIRTGVKFINNLPKQPHDRATSSPSRYCTQPLHSLYSDTPYKGERRTRRRREREEGSGRFDSTTTGRFDSTTTFAFPLHNPSTLFSQTLHINERRTRRRKREGERPGRRRKMGSGRFYSLLSLFFIFHVSTNDRPLGLSPLRLSQKCKKCKYICFVSSG